jgi:branched-chain amino acid transport system substrate-binding protein
MNKRKITTVVGVILITILLFAFQGNKTKTESVNIALLAPFTGVAAETAEYMQNAVSLAVDEINSNKSKKFKLYLLIEDTKYSPQGSVSAFKYMADIKNIKYFIGPYSSSEVAAIATLADKAKTILIAPGAQSGEIGSLSDYIFRTIHNTSQDAPAIARFIASKTPDKTVHFILLNNTVSPSYLKEFKPVFESLGGKIGLTEYFEATAIDFRTQITKIKSTNPQNIFILAAPKHAGMIIKQIRDLGINAQLYTIGVEGPDIFKIAGKLADGLIYAYSYDNADQNPNIQNFISSYESRYGTQPDAVAANSYDAVMLLGNCLEKNGNDVAKIRTCLSLTKNYNGASGEFSFDSNRDAIRSMFIKTVNDGKYVKY